MMEAIKEFANLGLPAWVLSIGFLLVVLHYTGVLASLGNIVNQSQAQKQSNLSFLINHITDRQSAGIDELKTSLERLAATIEELEDYQRELNKTIANLGTKVQFAYYEIVERPAEARDELRRAINDTQRRLVELEALRDDNNSDNSGT